MIKTRNIQIPFNTMDGNLIYPYVKEEHFPETVRKETKLEDGGLRIEYITKVPYNAILRDFSTWFLEKARGKRLIDLGSGLNEKTSHGIGAKLGCSEVVCVDPFYASDTAHSEMIGQETLSRFHLDNTIRVTRAPQDGLSYLVDQPPDDSAIIMANGVFTEPFAYAYGNIFGDQRPEWLEYLKDFISEIHRVTSTVFFGNGMYPQIKDLCKKSGFRQLNPYGPGKDLSGIAYFDGKGRRYAEYPESNTPIFTNYNSVGDDRLFLFEK